MKNRKSLLLEESPILPKKRHFIRKKSLKEIEPLLKKFKFNLQEIFQLKTQF